MREDEPNWFSKWEEQLPSPDDLIPLSQTLISPDLAIAFDIRNSPTTTTTATTPIINNNNISIPLNPATPAAQTPNSSEFDTSGGGGGDEQARTLKRPRLVWTPQLHKRFVDAVAHLGIKNAVPKTIMQLMSVDGLTRENVASHLQKYRLYLKRMQGLSTGSGGSDPATDHLFASSPVPAHFLHPGRGSGDHFLGFVPVAALQQHLQQQQQNAVGTGGVVGQQYRSVGHFGGTANGQFAAEHSFMARQQQSQQQQQQPVGVGRMVGTPVRGSVVAGNVEDLNSAGAVANGRKVLTLFPTGDD